MTYVVDALAVFGLIWLGIIVAAVVMCRRELARMIADYEP